MIYLDNAATTWPKPPQVTAAASQALRIFGANPGRGSYDMAAASDNMVYQCRKKAALLFGAASPESVIFTPGCTYSINFVLRGILRPGDHVIISDLEHNAVVRPIYDLEGYGVSVSRAKVIEGDAEATLNNFKAAIRRNTKMIFCTHASNVFGTLLPIDEIGDMCRRYGLLFGIDAAQTAGLYDINITKQNIDFLCVPAHKGLYGIMGLGMLIMSGRALPEPIITGGTGSASASRAQPDELPDRLECGTSAVPAICALSAGMDFVSQRGISNIRRHEHNTISHIYEELRKMRQIELYTMPPREDTHSPLLSFNIAGMESSQTGERLAAAGIAVRTGFHCAYDAHIACGTERGGTVRVCPSIYSTYQESDVFLRTIYGISQTKYPCI